MLFMPPDISSFPIAALGNSHTLPWRDPKPVGGCVCKKQTLLVIMTELEVLVQNLRKLLGQDQADEICEAAC